MAISPPITSLRAGGRARAYLKIVRAGAACAHATDRSWYRAIPPSRPETGYGYTRAGRGKAIDAARASVFSVRPPLREKPALALAGNMFLQEITIGNAGMFFWPRFHSFSKLLKSFLPKDARHADAPGKRKSNSAIRATLRSHLSET